LRPVTASSSTPRHAINAFWTSRNNVEDHHSIGFNIKESEKIKPLEEDHTKALEIKHPGVNVISID
jgi:hypothetical protein